MGGQRGFLLFSEKNFRKVENGVKLFRLFRFGQSAEALDRLPVVQLLRVNMKVEPAFRCAFHLYRLLQLSVQCAYKV